MAKGNFEIQFLTPKDALTAGEEFQVHIVASGVNDIKGYVFEVEYNLSQLDVVENPQAVTYQHLAQETEFLKKSGHETLFFAKAMDSSDKRGRITVAGFITGKGMGVSGDGSLAQLRFRVKNQPDFITLNNIVVADHEGTMRSLPVKSLSLEPIPQQDDLGNNFPNPFNPDTWIPYQLSSASQVVIKIYNVQGQLIRILDLGRKDAGYYTTKAHAGYWDGKNTQGEKVASGVYFYTIKANNFVATKRLVVLK